MLRPQEYGLCSPFPARTCSQIAPESAPEQQVCGRLCRGGRSYRQRNGHGPVVEQVHLHVGAEAARGDFRVQGARPLDDLVVQALALGRWRGAREAGAVAAAGVGRQRELADDEQAAAGALPVQVLHAAVHLARVVGKDAQLEHLGQQLVGFGLGVAALCADQGQQAGAYAAGDLAVDFHAGLFHALQDADHCSGFGFLSVDGEGVSAWPAASMAASMAVCMPRGSSSMRAYSPGTACRSSASISVRSRAARATLQSPGTCMCRSAKLRSPARRLEMLSKTTPCSRCAWRSRTASMRRRSGASSAWSIRPWEDCQTSCAPCTQMLSATPMATAASSHSQPVSDAPIRPMTTPAEVQTSVSRWRASPSSAMERCWRAERSMATASRPLRAELTTDSARPQPSCSSGCGFHSRASAAQAMARLAPMTRMPSKPAEKYSALRSEEHTSEL